MAEKLLSQLKGADWDAFADDLKPQLCTLKRTANGRLIAAIERLLVAVAGPPHAMMSLNTEPTSPALQVDVSSVVPTPVLTMEPNTPQSSGPPSTNAGAAEESADDNNSKVALDTTSPSPEVHVDDP